MAASPPRLGIVGAGGLGGYLAVRLAQAGCRVSVLARGAHLEAIRRQGLVLESPLGNARAEVTASDRAAELGPQQLVLVATKTFHLAGVLPQLEPLLGPDSIVAGFQNGVEAAATMAGSVGAERVWGGTGRIIAYQKAPGAILHAGIPPTFLVGPLPGSRVRQVPASLAAAFAAAPGLELTASEHIELAIWEKFLFFAPMSAVGAATQAPIGVCRSVPAVRALLRDAMLEVHRLGRARGIAFAEDLVDRTMAFVDAAPPDGTTSLQRDIRDGRPTELDALAGAVVRLAAETGVPAPVHRVLAAVLEPPARRAEGALAW